MTYIYKFVTLPVSQDQQAALNLGVVSLEEINPIIEKCINEQAKDGWEPFYPFSFPSIWFRKQTKAKKSVTNA